MISGGRSIQKWTIREEQKYDQLLTNRELKIYISVVIFNYEELILKNFDDLWVATSLDSLKNILKKYVYESKMML